MKLYVEKLPKCCIECEFQTHEVLFRDISYGCGVNKKIHYYDKEVDKNKRHPQCPLQQLLQSKQ